MPSPDDEPPRVTHVLRPHHIALLSVFILVLRDPVSPGLNLHIWRLLAREIAEVSPPKPFQELIQAISGGPSDIPNEATKLAQGMRNVPKHLATHDGMSQFFADVIAFVPEKEEDQQPQLERTPIERRSYFGLFIRRCYLSYFKLSWRGAMKLLKDYKSWISGNIDSGYNLQSGDREGGLLLVPTASDELQYAKIDPYEKFEHAAKIGDTQSAIENLRRFFDQRFSEDKESGVTQHALLHLAHLHYSLGEWSAARQAAEEALKIARTANDSIAAQHCTNLLRRISPFENVNAPPTIERSLSIKHGTSPIEVLWEIKRLVDNGEPLRIAFKRLYEAMGCNDALSASACAGPGLNGIQGAYDEDMSKFKWARHAVQATLWSMAGVESLAQTHEGLVIAFTETGEDDSRLTAICARATRLARQGNCGSALVVLLNPETWKGLNLRQYGVWANTIWNALTVTAARRMQTALLHDFLLPRKPPVPLQYSQVQTPGFFPSNPGAVASLRAGEALRKNFQAAESIKRILDGLWQSEFRGLWGLHRIGVAMLADVAIELGMATRGRRIIEDVLPQLLNGDDLEARAFACYTLGRCIMASSTADESLHTPPPPEKQLSCLMEAFPFFHVAERDYGAIEMYEERLESLYMLSVIYHNLALLGKEEMLKDRDKAAELYHEVEAQRRAACEMEADEELRSVWDLVVQAGSVVTR